MDIAPYIADLLRQHDEVNVPSLGTFCKQRKSGFYDPEKKIFFPPLHGLVFKTAEEDSLLASYISERKSISLSTANYFIEKFVSQIKSLISTYGEAEIEPLGTLKRSNESYILIDTLNLDAEGEYFGLQPIKELSEAATEPVYTTSQESTVIEEKPDDAVNTEPVSEEVIIEERKVSTASKILLVAASLVLIGIITYLAYPKAFEVFRQETSIPDRNIPAKQPEQATIPKTFADSLAEADTIYQELTKQGFEAEKPRDTLEVSTESTTVTTVPPPALTFEIIGAAFARRAEAESYVKLMTTKGVYAKIVENMPGSKLKISLGTFNDEDSAKKELIRIQKELNKDAWIARVKPKKTN